MAETYKTGIEASLCPACLSNLYTFCDWATPYSLVHDMEALLPVEVEISSLQILMETEIEEAKWAQCRYDQLNFVEEKRLTALRLT